MFSSKRAIVGVAAAAATLVAAGPASASGRVVAVDGVAKGRSDLRIEILVQVKAGQSARAAAARALEAQGAKPAPAPPPQSAGFTLTGLRWEAFPVVQHYNSAGQP